MAASRHGQPAYAAENTEYGLSLLCVEAGIFLVYDIHGFAAADELDVLAALFGRLQ
jgi:hypothetical protein